MMQKVAEFGNQDEFLRVTHSENNGNQAGDGLLFS